MTAGANERINVADRQETCARVISLGRAHDNWDGMRTVCVRARRHGASELPRGVIRVDQTPRGMCQHVGTRARAHSTVRVGWPILATCVRRLTRLRERL